MRSSMHHLSAVTLLGLALVLAACTRNVRASEAPPRQDPVVDDRAGLVAPDRVEGVPYVRLPVIDAWHEGEKVWFVHTEVSDQAMAKRLTEMVDYPTIHVPRLGQVDPRKACKLYVFKNGVPRRDARPWGGGPFHFQIDVVDSVPGDPDYTPLRSPRLVTWDEGAAPRVLKSEEEVLAAERAGELTVERTDVIVNAPIVAPTP